MARLLNVGLSYVAPGSRTEIHIGLRT